MGEKLRKAAMIGLGFTAAAGGAEHLHAEPQQGNTQRAEQRTGPEQSKEQEFSTILAEAKKLDDFEQKNYQDYIKSKSGSPEEKALFDQLNRNHPDLIYYMGRVLILSRDASTGAINQAHQQEWLRLSTSLNKRNTEISQAGKKLFDTITRPPEVPKP